MGRCRSDAACERARRMEDASRVDGAASASYFLSAVGLAIPKFGRPIAARNEDDGRLRRIDTEYWPCALQPL